MIVISVGDERGQGSSGRRIHFAPNHDRGTLRVVLHGLSPSARLGLTAQGRRWACPSRSGATMTTIKNIVLVHGGFVDGSGWQGVYDELAKDGFHVRIVQNPTLSLAGDVAATHQVLDSLDGPAVLVG